ncbi:hypothetical protein Tco_0309251 [Tanacetum coccineum]
MVDKYGARAPRKDKLEIGGEIWGHGESGRDIALIMKRKGRKDGYDRHALLMRNPRSQQATRLTWMAEACETWPHLDMQTTPETLDSRQQAADGPKQLKSHTWCEQNHGVGAPLNMGRGPGIMGSLKRKNDLSWGKRISEKRKKNQAKTDKTKHGMERREKDKMQQAKMAALQESDRRRQAQMAETLRVMRDMRREMSDMQAELLAHREQQRRARQPGPDARIPDHQDASGDADSHI